MLIGCGGRAPEPLPNVIEKPQRVDPSLIAEHARIPRPTLPIQDPRPDLSEEPRWPLSVMQHPALEPQFDVAAVLADPGISWTELCARGVHHRRDPAHRDELAYLAAWCAAEQHDISTSVTALVPLMSSTVPGIASAVPFDLANVLVASVDGDHATQLLGDLAVRDAHEYDLLAAAYFEVGKSEDAVRTTSTAMQLDAHTSPATACHRLARMVLLSPPGSRPFLVQQLSDARSHFKNDPTCDELAASVPCAVDVGDCRDFFFSQHMTWLQATVATLYEHWDVARDWTAWVDYARALEDAVIVTGAKELAFAALDAAVLDANCSVPALRAIARRTDMMGVPFRPKVTWMRTLIADRGACRRWVAANRP